MILIMKKANWNRLKFPAITLSAIVFSVAVMNAAGIRINWTPSEPMGIYRVQPVSVGIDRGDLIEFCYEGTINHYMTHGVCPNGSAPFFKSVAAVPGDMVVVGDAGVLVNGVMLPDSRPLLRSVTDPSLTLPVLRGRFKLKQGQYWSYGSGLPGRSFDSRYFGPVGVEAIRSVAKGERHE